jgi:hypothetical protein
MDIVIDNGIAIPKERPNFKRHIDKLEVGQSFRVDPEFWTSLRNAASNMNKRTEKQFVVNKVSEPVDPTKPDGKETEFARIWRKK